MLFYTIQFKNQYNAINDTCFINCSDTPDSLLNYSEYLPLYSVSTIDSADNQILNNEASKDIDI